MSEERIEVLQGQISKLTKELQEEKSRTKFLQEKFDALGLQGKAKLYYSLNRNMSDIADMLDKVQFSTINLDNKEDKTMERLKMLWASVKPVAETINVLESFTKLTGNEKEDTAPKNVLEFAETRK